MFRYNFIFNPHYVQLNIVIMYEDWLFFGPQMRSDCRISCMIGSAKRKEW